MAGQLYQFYLPKSTVLPDHRLNQRRTQRHNRPNHLQNPRRETTGFSG
ncbi:MAG: hypothetical protein ACKPCI_10255 [Dolichospermum sp.]